MAYSPLLPKPYYYHYQHQRCFKINLPKWTTRASSAAPGVDLNTLQSAISKKDSDAVKEALNQLGEVGWAKKWSSHICFTSYDITARADKSRNKKRREPCNS